MPDRALKLNRPNEDRSAAQTATRRRRLWRWVPVAAILVAMAAAYLAGLHEYISLDNVIRERRALKMYVDENFALAMVLYAATYVAVVALSFPGASILTVAGGFVFGWVWAGLVTVVAATAGATIIFAVARSSLGAALRERAGPFAQRLAAGFREDAWSYLLFLRLAFVFPFWLVNIAPALFHVPLATFVGATAIGIVPGTFAYAFLGAGLDSLIAEQEAANPGCAEAGTCEIVLGSLLTPTMIGAILALALIALLPALVKRWRRRR